jgi:group II intron reverse transcriptase/maturase
MVLEAVYEQEFLDCSYGFRPGRSAHQALQRLWEVTTEMKGGVVLEADIQGFFDNLVPTHLRSFLDQRVRDGVIRRAIDKWLKAGVLEEGRITHPDTGTPQGGVISPLLANIYLHEVLDKWFEADVRPRLTGRAALIRYADDFVIVLSSENDARRVLDVLAKRFAKYGLTLHPDKTRLVPFDRPRGGAANTGTRPGTFDLLGFTHYWGRSFRGWWIVKRQTARSRFSRALKRVSEWCRRNRYRPVVEQQQALNRKLRGHYGYYGITTNFPALRRFKEEVQCIWRKWLNRRSQRTRMNWDRFHLLLRRYPLLPAQVTHAVHRRRAANC